MTAPAPLTAREIAAILAGLRLYQREAEAHGGVRFACGVASDDGRLEPLTAAEIDDLCERINTGGGATP